MTRNRSHSFVVKKVGCQKSEESDRWTTDFFFPVSRGFEGASPGDESLASCTGSFSRLKLHQDDRLFERTVFTPFVPLSSDSCPPKSQPERLFWGLLWNPRKPDL